MSAQNEDFLFTQEALALGLVTEAQVEEAFLLQKRMAEDLKLDERVAVILVKRGYLAEDQARRVHAKVQPDRGAPGEIQGYSLLEVIGRGAMGTVYRALHLGLNRVVALKILRQDLAGDRTQVERLKAEAGMLASLDHPNIVRALDAGESNGFPYVVMEYVEGETLRDRLRREGCLAEGEALRIARCIADALERARRMGVVHRDVKPGNILISKAGVPKLMDLGLAKGPIDLGLTQHGATVGTPQYIAPEQAVDPRKADTRSDIYGLGATLYAMLTGRPPFDGQTLAEILTKVLYQSPTPVRVLRPDASVEAGYLVERMMLRDPALRYRTPAQVVSDIDRLMQGTSILPAGFQGNWEAFLVRKQARRWIFLSAGAIAAGVLVALGVAALVRGGQRADARRLAHEQVALFLAEALSPRDDRSRLERLEKEGEAIEAHASGAEPGNLPDLRRRLGQIRAEIGWFAHVTEAEARAGEAADAGDFAEAERVWTAALQKVPVASAARSAAQVRLQGLRVRSDRALDEAFRREFAAAPDRWEGVVGSLSAWRDALVTRYALTPDQSLRKTAAEEALEAARDVAGKVSASVKAVGPGEIHSRIDRFEFAALLREIRDRGTLARKGLDAVLPALSRGNFYAEAHLANLVASPFEALERTVEEQVTRRWRDVILPDVDRLVSEGQSVEAIERLDRFAAAAAEGGAYPALAQEARAHRDEVAQRDRQVIEAATAAMSSLVDEVLAHLRAQDEAALQAALDAASANEALYRPLAGDLAQLKRVPGFVATFWRRVLDTFEAHVGEDRSLWIPSVEMRDGTVDKLWLVRSVDRARRSVEFVSHRGGFASNPQVRTLDAIGDAELDRLAGLKEGVAEDDTLRGLHALWGLKTAEEAPDFYERQAALLAVREAFRRGGDVVGPLWKRVDAWLASVDAEIVAREGEANEHWETAQREMREGKYSEANFHYEALAMPPLSFTKFARAHAGEIERERVRIKVDIKLTQTARVFPGVQVVRRSDPVRPSESSDVELFWTFNTREQIEKFDAGLFRLAPSGPGRNVTPGADPNDMALELLPGLEGHVVTDRPLAIETCLDPAFARSVEFDLWTPAPVFLGIDLDGVGCGILSMDPQQAGFPPDVPKLEGEKAPPRSDHYGRGRGIVFRVGTDLSDPASWPWDDGVQGRHFVPPESGKSRVKDHLQTKWFAFEPGHNRPYHVKFTFLPDKDKGTVILEVDAQDRAVDSGPAYRSPKPTGHVQILTFTTCLIDNLKLTGRLDTKRLDSLETGRTRPK